jgi:VIT1/CCC1 family predicted Fe2+/Mn2+ transporter
VSFRAGISPTVAQFPAPRENTNVVQPCGSLVLVAHNDDGPGSLGNRLNWLRAGVLGANDGIVSTAGIVIGVAGATADRTAILVAGFAGLVAGALSMAGGEYTSVSTQRDTEASVVETERRELAEDPAGAEDRLAASLRGRGLSAETARTDPDELTNPWSAAVSSFISFTCGALLPLLAITLLPEGIRVLGCAIAVVVALAITGYISARLGGAPRGRATLRVMAVGAATMAVTYALGTAFDVATA